MAVEDGTGLKAARQAGIAAFVGTTIEWYDFFIFTTASGLIFGKLFFPELNPAAGALASFATLWVGYVGRPLGGLLFGHVGDRVGRKTALIITLLLMGAGTTAIGLLPTFHQIGIAAPVLLAALRLGQGIALGGEWGGAVLIASESAPKGRRISFGNFAQQGTPAGAMLSTLAFIPVAALPASSFESWGWRLPFLFSALLVLVGLVVRLKIEDPPEFERARERKELTKVPAVEVFRISAGTVFLGIGACAVGIGMSGMKNPFILSWATMDLGIARSTMLNILLVTTVVQFVTQPLAAHYARRFGAPRVMVGSLVATVLVLVPCFALLGTAVPVLAGVGLCILMMTQSGYYAILAGFMAEAFPVRVRYTGISLAYQLAGTVFGAIPIVAQLLLTLTEAVWASVAFYGAIVLISTVSVIAISRRARKATALSPRSPQHIVGSSSAG